MSKEIVGIIGQIGHASTIASQQDRVAVVDNEQERGITITSTPNFEITPRHVVDLGCYKSGRERRRERRKKEKKK